MSVRRGFLGQFLLLFLGAGTVSAANDLDVALLKKNIQIFEKILSEIIKQNFPHPFGITVDPQGGYLQGYGVVVSFHLNINRAGIRTPFGEIEARGSRRPKPEQLQILRNSMVRCLADYGTTFKQLGAQDRIAISARVEDRNELDPTQRITILVFSVSKQEVDRFATRSISFGQFEEKVQILEY